MQRRVACVVAVVAACGPSDAQIRTAKTATYATEPQRVFELAMDAARESYKIGGVDQARLVFATVPRVYNPDGGLESTGADDYLHFQDHSMRVSLLVEIVVTADHHVAVTVTPRAQELLAGSPKPRDIAPDDPALPGFVHGRVDALAYAIFERAKPYYVAPH